MDEGDFNDALLMIGELYFNRRKDAAKITQLQNKAADLEQLLGEQRIEIDRLEKGRGDDQN